MNDLLEDFQLRGLNVVEEVATKTENFFRALDREKRAQYILTVAADLPDTASTTTFRVFVAVLDINDNPPVFDQVRRARSQHDP